MRSVLLVSVLLVLPGTGIGSGEKQGSTRVEGLLVVPAEVPSFAGRVVEIRLYKFDLRLADKAADLVEKLEIKDFSHQTGTETKRGFVIGDKRKLEARMSYYLTLFLLDQGKRTHIGECRHARGNLCRVLTDGNPSRVTLDVRPVKK
jgi:hypothetical protein